MSHLTPVIPSSFLHILEQSGISYLWYDSDGESCCGRPLMLAGQVQTADQIRQNLTRDFLASGARILVTSCPICLQTFKEDYALPGMRIMFHAELILEMMEWDKVRLNPHLTRGVLHRSCELRKNEASALALEQLAIRVCGGAVIVPDDRLCCGGSLAALSLDLDSRQRIAKRVVSEFNAGSGDLLITACPLCKKSLANVTDVPVMDIAEVVAGALATKPSALDARGCRHAGVSHQLV